ncbi:MAG TPA: BTAD domain-containing putative transcriptional regulator [Candidatus Elarobacter sp.]|nr:BTAD domain-containing putative transcriptional regulator [Candidatus Elarobacter sp.]
MPPWIPPSDRLALTLFGELDLRGPAPGDIAHVIAQPKLVALLAYLAVAGPGHFVRRDRLVGLLWMELDQIRARAALRRALHAIRDALGAIVLARGDEELAIADGMLWCDVPAFDRAMSSGYHAAALELYRDELLPGFHIVGASAFGHWLDGERAERKAHAAVAAWSLAERFEAGGELTNAGGWARRAVLLAGEDERTLRRAIALLDRVGDRAAAVRLYVDFARRLHEELEMEPSPETRAMIARWRDS